MEGLEGVSEGEVDGVSGVNSESGSVEGVLERGGEGVEEVDDRESEVGDIGREGDSGGEGNRGGDSVSVYGEKGVIVRVRELLRGVLWEISGV